jgi:hypothetical protein
MKTALCVLSLLAVSGAWASKKEGPDPDPRDREDFATALHGPVLGLVFDAAARNVRPVLGFPGAATLGAPLAVPFAFENAFPAHRGGFALVVDQADGAVVQITATGVRKPAGVAAAPDKVVFSPSNVTAALYHADRGVVEVVRHLPAAPALTASLNLAALPGPLSALAVSDAGLVVAACRAAGDSDAVFVFAPGRAMFSVLSVRRIAGIAFLGSSADALVGDAAANVIYRIHGAAAGAAITVVAGAAEGVSVPVALAASADGKRAVIANSGPAPVLVLNLETGEAKTAACSCRIAAAEPMAGNAVFRLTGPDQSPMWLLDADPPNPRVMFVPPHKAEGGAK